MNNLEQNIKRLLWIRGEIKRMQDLNKELDKIIAKANKKIKRKKK